ncbi:hypothetical protein A464_4462 [Salmonella bongori N268-08]|uniref:Uncharacterized protein n=1 Tax=Salmonella bongori N268-08 TaxID=1197719 RepID=S5N423_SALBN|nr:hypothetical protein A464_4462 [Salmonella bongori N268-08]
MTLFITCLNFKNLYIDYFNTTVFSYTQEDPESDKIKGGKINQK